MISWFHALFSVLNIRLRRFESLLSDNDYLQLKGNYHLFVQCFDGKSQRLFSKNNKITHI